MQTRSLRKIRSSIQWLAAAGFVLSVASASWAGAPVEQSVADEASPVPRCVVDDGTEPDQVAGLRQQCDVLSYLNGCALGFVRPSNPNDSGTTDGNGDTCSSGDSLWRCFGVQCP